MKSLKIFLVTAIWIVMTYESIASVNLYSFSLSNQDSLNLLAEFSLFYEYYKNKDFESAEKHGWNVINTDPSNFLQYKPFKKMEEIIWYLHDSVATSEENLMSYTDTVIHLYDKAVEVGAKNPEYFVIKKAYVIETWKNPPVEDIVSAYENAFTIYPEAPSFYKDRLGIIYAQNATETNGYKLRALDLYSRLSEEEPENEVWLQRIDGLAENIEELIDIRKKAWYLDKENLEKAYKYAETCYRAQNFELAVEPLEFLTSKASEVINYWRKLASVYTKLENSDKAISSYKTLIELEPNNRDNYFNIAILYQKIAQLSVARSYLYKASQASEEAWDLPVYYESQLYEQAARNCGFEFMDKCVYQLAVDTYKKAAAINGPQSSSARERVRALSNSVPQPEDYFFRKLKSGAVIKIEGKCYGWINRSIIVP
ncbi:tetratricopeptide repeat protein [Bacteroidota bacterium]